MKVKVRMGKDYVEAGVISLNDDKAALMICSRTLQDDQDALEFLVL
jgi:hypothetical protein